MLTDDEIARLMAETKTEGYVTDVRRLVHAVQAAERNSKDIKPCPFCGGEASYDDHKHDHYGLDAPGVECTSCNVRNFAPTKADAISAWNRRA